MSGGKGESNRGSYEAFSNDIGEKNGWLKPNDSGQFIFYLDRLICVSHNKANVYPLHLALNEHYCSGPLFMN